MQVTIEWISRKYSEFNSKYFENSLPDASEMKFSVNHRRSPVGFASFTVNRMTRKAYNFGIAISNFYDSTEHGKEAVLIHEMCHISHYSKRISDFLTRDRYGRTTINKRFDAHSGFFLEEAERINAVTDYNISRYYPSDASSEASNDNLYNLSDKAKKKLSAKTYMCVFNAKNGKLSYFHCPKSKMEFFNERIEHLGCTNIKWYVTDLANTHGLPKSLSRLTFYSRKNPEENNIEFLTKYFDMEPYKEENLDERIKRVVDEVISEITSSETTGERIKASSTPIVKQNDDVLYYGVE